jgi:hypothetical protein
MLRIVALALTSALTLFACSPSARSLPCQNDADCTKASSDFHFCSDARCVACVGSNDCGDGKQCIAGACMKSCKKTTDCGSDDRCVDEVCRHEGS